MFCVAKRKYCEFLNQNRFFCSCYLLLLRHCHHQRPLFFLTGVHPTGNYNYIWKSSFIKFYKKFYSTVKNQPQQWPVTTYYHQQRLIQPGATYTIQGAEQPLPVQIPAIPIQVPLQAQFSPAANVHNVQLVPCLCPVSQEFEYDSKPQETTFISPKQPQK